MLGGVIGWVDLWKEGEFRRGISARRIGIVSPQSGTVDTRNKYKMPRPDIVNLKYRFVGDGLPNPNPPSHHKSLPPPTIPPPSINSSHKYLF